MAAVPKYSSVLEEDSHRTAIAAIKRRVLVIEDDVDSPVQSYPLSPCAGILSEGKVLQCRQWPHDLITFSSQFSPQSNEVFLIVSLCNRQVLGHVEQIAGAGANEVYAALRHDGPRRVIGEAWPKTVIVIDLLRFVIAEDAGKNELAILQQLAIDAAVDAQLRQKEAADAAAGMGIGKPVIGKIAGDSRAVIPTGIAITVLPRSFSAESISATGGKNAHVSVPPGDVRTRIHVAVSSAKLDVPGTVQAEGNRSQSGNAGALRRRRAGLLGKQCRQKEQQK